MCSLFCISESISDLERAILPLFSLVENKGSQVKEYPQHPLGPEQLPVSFDTFAVLGPEMLLRQQQNGANCISSIFSTTFRDATLRESMNSFSVLWVLPYCCICFSY